MESHRSQPFKHLPLPIGAKKKEVHNISGKTSVNQTSKVDIHKMKVLSLGL